MSTKNPYEILKEMVSIAPEVNIKGPRPHPNWKKYCSLSGRFGQLAHTSNFFNKGNADFNSYRACIDGCLEVIEGKIDRGELEKIFDQIPIPESIAA